MDLFVPVVPPEQFHKNFANCVARQNPYNEAAIAKWADGFVDRDGKFVKEFQTTFNSSFWELYLHAILKESGCKIDFAHHAPDFVVTDPIPFVIEATVALNAKESLPEWTPFDIELHPRDFNEFNRAAMLRLMNSISEKTRKYKKTYHNLPHVDGKPFVLALTPFDQPFFYLEMNRAIEAVLYGFYVDEQEHIDDPSKGFEIPTKTLKSVRKNETVEIPLGIFNDDSHAHISAVIYNSSATWGKVVAMSDDPNPMIFFTAARHDPRTSDLLLYQGTKSGYVETIFDGLRVYHNPHAAFPLDWRVFQEPGAMQAQYIDPQKNAWRYWMDRPPLFSRNLITFNTEGASIEEVKAAMAGVDNGGWYKMPFSQEMLQEVANFQKSTRCSATSGTP